MPEDFGGEIIIEDALLAGGFVQVPALIFFDPALRDGPVRLYGALLWYAWKQGRAPEQSVMAEELGMGERTVRRHLAELEAAGYIRVEQLGLGRPNRYIIKSINSQETPQRPQEAQNPDRPNLAGLGGQNWPVQAANIGRSYRVVESRDVKEDTLSHSAPALVAAFFAAMGEAKPAKQRAQRALKVINGLLAEGFGEDTIREACTLAGARGARGPDLLPHVIGEAHERIQARAVQTTRRRKITAATEAQVTLNEASLEAGLEAVQALPATDRARLERECRAALPPSLSEAMAAAVLPGMMAARLRTGGPS
jgi:hypothetical protein